MRKVLWLVSWYPNERDLFTGDFIKRMGEAVSGFQPLKIIYAGRNGRNYHERKEISLSDQTTKALEEFILYYPASGEKPNMVSKLKSIFSYFKLHFEIIRNLKKNDELPDIVHVQVALKAGLIALCLKWKFKIPYVLTEHWTGYYQSAKNNLFQKSFATRYLTRLIIKNSARFMPVSEALGNQINQYWIKTDFQKIPNVVNTRLFYPGEKKPDSPFRFIHISSMIYQKNPHGIIRAFAALLQTGIQAELALVGPLSSELAEFIKTVDVPAGTIQEIGEVSYEKVGIELRRSEALILFSYYENLPCVILESLCSGIPVIATKVGGIQEEISLNNGLLVQAGNENELLEAMKKMVVTYKSYDKAAISREAMARYSYETIGKKIVRIYDEVLEKNNHR